MLQKLNERIQGVIAWVVIGLIAVTFTLFGVDYYMQSHGVSDAEVTVNGEAISKQAYEVSFRRTRQQHDPEQFTASDESALKKKVLEDMISNLVSVEAAHKNGFQVSIEQANAAILSIPQFQQDGQFSSERYQQALSGAMFTPESFQQEVRQGMLLNQQRFAFIGSSFVLPEEIERFVKLYMQTRDYDYVQIPASLFTDKVKISDDEVKNYYASHQQEFIAPEQVSIDYIRLSMKKVKEQLKINDTDVKKFYEENQANFLTPAQWQVSHIMFAIPEGSNEDSIEQIKQKADDAYQALQNNPLQFDEWVKTISSDKLSAANKGVLPWIVAGQTSFDKALAELNKPGEISAPIKTDKGYEIFKLIAYKPAELKPFAEVKEQITEQLAAEQLQTKFAQLQEQLSDLSYQTPDSLNPVAEEMKLPVEQSKPFSRKGGDTKITRMPQIINMAFSHDVLESGNNSEPLQLDNDSVIVLRVNKHLPATEQSLSEVKEQIVEKLTRQNASVKAKELGTMLLANKGSSEVDEQLLAKHKLSWKQVEQATRETDKTDALINDLAFSLPKKDNQSGKILENGDFVVVRLKKINDGNLNTLDKEQQASIAQQIETSYGLMDYDLYMSNLVRSAKIEKN